MSKPSALTTKRLVTSLVCLALASIVLFALHFSGFDSYLDKTLYDYFLSLKIKQNPKALNRQIIPVDLNDKSDMNLGSRLSDRSAFADMFSVIAYSNAQVALDLIFQGEREKDNEMLEAAAKLKGLIIGMVSVPEGRENKSYRLLTEEEKVLVRQHLWKPKVFGEGNIPRAGTFIMPFLGLGKLASQLATLSVEPDSDGIYRRTPLFYAWEDGFIPAISLATALWELGVSGNDIEIHYGKKVLIPISPAESFSIPIDSAGNLVVPFGGKWEHTLNRLSMDELANAWYDNNTLNSVRNDIMRLLCFVGDTTYSAKDIGPVPMESYYPLVGLHTWVLSAILDSSMGKDAFYREMPLVYRVICIVFVAMLFLILGIIRKDRIFNSVSAALFLGFSGLMLYLWFFKRIIPWYTLGAFEISLIWLFGFIHRFSSQRKKQSAMERYVPRSVAHQLVNGERTGLVPIYKDLTIMFSDIVSFTKWSSDKEASVVHAFLNDYLESMADILFQHGATVDKFIGDGILAFFGDPITIPNHPAVAINAALAMQERVRALREKWEPQVGIKLQIRIGINSGRVIVGDLGTKRRIEYTVIGSTVNMAQRMESLATPGGILVTGETKMAVDSIGAANTFSFGEKRELTVKGYDVPIIAYDIIKS